MSLKHNKAWTVFLFHGNDIIWIYGLPGSLNQAIYLATPFMYTVPGRARHGRGQSLNQPNFHVASSTIQQIYIVVSGSVDIYIIISFSIIMLT